MKGRTPSNYDLSATRLVMLLQAFDLKRYLGALWDDGEQKYGLKSLNFESFDRLFPTFPWQLVAQSFYNTTLNPQVSLRYWLRRFDETFIMKGYIAYLISRDQYASEVEKTRPLGMIFPLAVRHGLILHNGPPQTIGSKFCIDLRCGDIPRRCWIERYSLWLKAVARSGWSPDAPLTPLRQSTPAAEPRPGAWIEPWMIRCTGGMGPDTMVLAWLCRCLFAEDLGPIERYLLGRDKGHPCIIATHAQIASQMPPLSERQVRSALAALRKRGLIATNQQHIRLIPEAIERAFRGDKASR